jgi:hypothetical protein
MEMDSGWRLLIVGQNEEIESGDFDEFCNRFEVVGGNGFFKDGGRRV